MRWMALAALCGCSTTDAPAWALQHAQVTVSADSGTITGYQTWEFYSEKWADDRSKDEHLCARVQNITGEAEPVLPDGCPACIASYALTVEELETDCSGSVAGDDSYAGVTRYAIGAVDSSVQDLDPYPGDSMGWYVSWSTDDVEALGFAYAETLDEGEEAEAPGWVAGLTYTFWPGFVWDLSKKG